ncbi:serotriflin-like [Hipposideros larvatus]
MMSVGICFVVLLQQAAGMSNIPVFSLLTQNSTIQMEIINKHNDLRRMAHPSARNMLKMTWNDEVAKNAENWASQCTQAHSPPYKRRISFAGCGENLYMSSNPRPWSEAIQTLYNEVNNFKYGFGSTRANAKIGHYTQLVWATSHQVGCALAQCPHSVYKYYYVCQYCPSGNVNTMKTPYKPGKPCEDCPHNCDNGLCTNICMHADKISNCEDLVKQQGCDGTITKGSCEATCKCPSAIK